MRPGGSWRVLGAVADILRHHALTGTRATRRAPTVVVAATAHGRAFVHSGATQDGRSGERGRPAWDAVSGRATASVNGSTVAIATRFVTTSDASMLRPRGTAPGAWGGTSA